MCVLCISVLYNPVICSSIGLMDNLYAVCVFVFVCVCTYFRMRMGRLLFTTVLTCKDSLKHNTWGEKEGQSFLFFTETTLYIMN